MPGHPSDSSEQQKAGFLLVDSVSKKLGVRLKTTRLELGQGCTVELDGYSEVPPILCEVWAHLGVPRGSQPDKIMSDALKLLFCERSLATTFRKIIVFADQAAASPFIGNGWKAACLKQHGIEIIVLNLSGTPARKVKEAQERQRMINRGGKNRE